MGKCVLISLVVWLFKFPIRTAVAVGLSMAQIGEFAFVLLSVASQLGLMPYQVYMLLMGELLKLCLGTNPACHLPNFFDWGNLKSYGSQVRRKSLPPPALKLSVCAPFNLPFIIHINLECSHCRYHSAFSAAHAISFTSQQQDLVGADRADASGGETSPSPMSIFPNSLACARWP